MQKHQEKPENHGYQKRKFQKTIEGTSYLPFPRPLLALRNTFSQPEYIAALALWEYFQSPDVKHPEKFVISRSILASKAGVGERQAGSTIRKLQSIGALILCERRAHAGTYKWSRDFLVGVVYPTGTSDVPHGYNTMYPTGTAPVPHGYNIYIDTLLNDYIPSYTALSGHAPEGEGNLKGALRASLPDGKVAALRAAVESLWQGAGSGGSWPLHEIALVLRSYKINLFKIDNVQAYLKQVMRDGVALYTAKREVSNIDDNIFHSEEVFKQHLDALASIQLKTKNKEVLNEQH